MQRRVSHLCGALQLPLRSARSLLMRTTRIQKMKKTLNCHSWLGRSAPSSTTLLSRSKGQCEAGCTLSQYEAGCTKKLPSQLVECSAGHPFSAKLVNRDETRSEKFVSKIFVPSLYHEDQHPISVTRVSYGIWRINIRRAKGSENYNENEREDIRMQNFWLPTGENKF